MTLTPFAENFGPAPVPDFLREVLRGLSLAQKAIPSRFLYDAAGTGYFEKITAQPEYYLTRTELALLTSHGPELGRLLPENATVVEFGAGSPLKAELLLNALRAPRAYLPIDISPTALTPTSRRIQSIFPNISVHPLLGDFDRLERLRLPVAKKNLIGFFPGSTIGNLSPADAMCFLFSARVLLGPTAHFLIGVDLLKPLEILLPAYNDAAGLTAAFNLNLLHRINRELDGTFTPLLFDHEAIFNAEASRIEMHLRAQIAHRVRVGLHTFGFEEGETIHTENSYKYTKKSFINLAARASWQPLRSFVDAGNLFSLHLLS